LGGADASYILTAEHGYRIAVCMNGELERDDWAELMVDFGDTTDIEGTFNTD
jgi:hypothetical protein